MLKGEQNQDACLSINTLRVIQQSDSKVLSLHRAYSQRLNLLSIIAQLGLLQYFQTKKTKQNKNKLKKYSHVDHCTILLMMHQKLKTHRVLVVSVVIRNNKNRTTL